MWDCPNCGCQNILGLDSCPQCHKPRPEETTEAPAAPSSESGTQAKEASAEADPEPQVTTKVIIPEKGGNGAKS